MTKKFSDYFQQQISHNEAQRATTTRAQRAGQYTRKTITLKPEQIQYIAEIAEQNQVGILAMYRWLIDQGLESFEAGARPEPANKPDHDINTTHPTS